MDKKTLPIIILLVVVVIFYWQILEFLGIVSPAPETTTEVIDSSAIESQPPVDSGLMTSMVETSDTESNPGRQADTGSISEAATQATGIVSAVKADTITIETEKYQILLSSRGGGPLSIRLKEYTYRDGKQVEMLPEAVAGAPDFSFSEGSFRTSRLNFSCNLAPGSYAVSDSTLEVSYSHQSAEGAVLTRRFTFYRDEYHFDVQLVVDNNRQFGFERSYEIDWNSPLGVTEPNPKTDYQAMQAVAMQGDSRVKLDDFNDGKLFQVEEGYTSWVGVREKYFAAVMIPQAKQGQAAIARGSEMDVVTPDGTVKGKKITAGMKMQVAADGAQNDRFRIFVGPLDYTLMSRYQVGLEDMLGIGTTPFVGWIIKPFAVAIIWLLPRMYSVLPNYGLVLIVFAFLIKVVTLPLSMKSFKSMNAMKELQPKIEALKEKYKKDPQKLNKETMKLYKAHGVNPLSGCLPMLPQMPLFFALFAVIRATILLRNAPFVWFIDDLSRGAQSFTDPYIALVVVMVAMQALSQKLTMATSTQNKAMMYLMPVFMGWLFHSFASGLVLYWTSFSLFSLMDYLLFKRNKNAQVQPVQT